MKPLSELKAIAEAVNLDPHELEPWPSKEYRIRYCGNNPQDAEHIATFDPPTVKALIERIEELEKRTIPDDLTSYIQERVKAERERCAGIVERLHGNFGRRTIVEILDLESEASDAND